MAKKQKQQKTAKNKVDKKVLTEITDKLKSVVEPKQLPIWAIISAFAVTTLIFFWDQLAGNSFFWEDFVEYVLPVQTFAAREFIQNGVPFWNPYTFNGMPFFADLQVGFYYIPNRLLSLFMPSDGSLPVFGLQLIIIIHFFIAQLSLYFLARYWKISSYGGLISAVSYGFSMLLVCHVIHPMIIYHLAWFPLAVMFFSKAIKEGDIRSGLWSGLILGLSILSGHPQFTLYEFFFLGVYFIWEIVAQIRAKSIKNNAVSVIVSGVLPFIIAGGIFLVQYLPSEELAKHSQRDEMTYEKASEGSLEFRQAFTAIMPKIFGSISPADNSQKFYLPVVDDQGNKAPAPYYYYWETAFYFGITALMLGFIGVMVFYKQRIGGFLLTMMVFGFMFALGDNSFIFPIFHELPLFSQFRNPARMMMFVILAVTIFSGFGFDYLWRSTDKKRNVKVISVTTGIILLLTILGSAGVFSPSTMPAEIAMKTTSSATASIILAALVGAAMFMINGRLLRPEPAGVILFVIAFIDLFIAGGDFNRSPQDPRDSYKIQEQTKKVYQANPPDDIFRVNMRMYRPRFMAMNRNQGMVDEIMLLEGYNPLILKRVTPPLFHGNENDAEFQKKRKLALDMQNVKYGVWMDQKTGRPVFMQSNSYFPRAWMTYNVRTVQTDNIKDIMANENIDYRKTVLLEDEVDYDLPENSGDINNSVKCMEYENNYFKYDVTTDENGMLVFNEIWYPAWKAYVDGKETPIHIADYCYRAIYLPKGNHTVEMKYESEAYQKGFWISTITFILTIIGIAFISFVRNKNGQK